MAAGTGQVDPLASSRAYDVNDRGQVVGEIPAGKDGSSTHAFLFTGGHLRDLGTLPGRPGSTARGINEAGTVVGASGGRAFVYSNGKMTDLNALLAPAARKSGLVLTGAVAVNNKGQIAVNGVLNGHTHAYLLTPTGAIGR
jgi:probable HAF family extracellular repeat protein